MQIPLPINIILTIVCFCVISPVLFQSPQTQVKRLELTELEDNPFDVSIQLIKLKATTRTLMELIMSQNVQNEQRIRFEGYSGLNEVRGFMTGTQPYHQNERTGNRAPFSIHDHVSYFPLVGMGEFGAVLNGIPFYSRHNDPDMMQPGLSSQSYYTQRLIPQPLVPPSVTAAGSVANQIKEMQEYFRAWAEQNISIRDYRPYFNPMLGYVEGNFIFDTVDLSDPFRSDRHFIDAKTWAELASKIRYYFSGGRKNDLENLGYLPRILHDITIAETFTVKVGTTSVAQAITSTDRSKFAPIDLLGYLGQTSLPPNTASFFLSKTRKGIFLNTIFGKSKSATAGSATIFYICSPFKSESGCIKARNYACYPKNCSRETQDGTGNEDIKWTADEGFGGISYGPLSGCFSLQIYMTGIKGLTSLLIPLNGNLNLTASKLSDTVILEGCVGDTVPIVANFDYRVMYMPIDRDIPLNRLRVLDSTASALGGERNNYPEPIVSEPKTYEQLEESRNAYFKLNSRDSNTWVESDGYYELLDELMETIPGRDGYGAILNETIDGELLYHYVRRNEPLNAAYYNRFFSIKETQPDGSTKMVGRRRGFNDANLFVAKTTRSEVVPYHFPDPITGVVKQHSYSYAVPIELIYRTPLINWNPYGIGSAGVGDFWRLPYQFFEDYTTVYTDPSDTNGLPYDQKVYYNPTAKVYVTGSGHYIRFHKIEGISRNLRQRFPIPPYSSEKNSGLMNARALKHMFGLDVEEQKEILKADRLDIKTGDLFLWTSNSTSADGHRHLLKIDAAQIAQFSKGPITVVSSVGAGHIHSMQVTRTTGPKGFVYTIVDCDTVGPKCADGHSKLCYQSNSETQKCKFD